MARMSGPARAAVGRMRREIVLLNLPNPIRTRRVWEIEHGYRAPLTDRRIRPPAWRVEQVLVGLPSSRAARPEPQRDPAGPNQPRLAAQRV
jgi:hypothetical protein